MMKSRRTFYINSAQRASGVSDCDFTYTLDMGPSAKFNRVTAMLINIPKSFYLVQQGFNTFTLQENGLNATVTIPAGNYNIISFQVVLPPLLNAASITLGHTWSYAITYPVVRSQADTGKFTYTVTGNAGMQ